MPDGQIYLGDNWRLVPALPLTGYVALSHTPPSSRPLLPYLQKEGAGPDSVFAKLLVELTKCEFHLGSQGLPLPAW